jgi:hypothetical protein
MIWLVVGTLMVQLLFFGVVSLVASRDEDEGAVQAFVFSTVCVGLNVASLVHIFLFLM